MELNVKLTSKSYDKHLKINQHDLLLENPNIYRKLIGKLLYLIITRLAIAFLVKHLSQYMQEANKSHLDAALRVIRYVKNNSGLDILLDSNSEFVLTVFCESNWVACIESTRSVTSYCIKLENSLISSKVKKEITVSRSSCEAEYMSMGTTLSEIIWLHNLMIELGGEGSLDSNDKQLSSSCWTGFGGRMARTEDRRGVAGNTRYSRDVEPQHGHLLAAMEGSMSVCF